MNYEIVGAEDIEGVLGMSFFPMNVIMYDKKLIDYPWLYNIVIEHEVNHLKVNHLKYGELNVFRHIWLDVKDSFVIRSDPILCRSYFKFKSRVVEPSMGLSLLRIFNMVLYNYSMCVLFVVLWFLDELYYRKKVGVVDD